MELDSGQIMQGFLCEATRWYCGIQGVTGVVATLCMLWLLYSVTICLYSFYHFYTICCVIAFAPLWLDVWWELLKPKQSYITVITPKRKDYKHIRVEPLCGTVCAWIGGCMHCRFLEVLRFKSKVACFLAESSSWQRKERKWEEIANTSPTTLNHM